MSLVLITGIQAAGKSTVAQALAERLPRSVHVRGDAFRRMIVNGRAEMGPANPSHEAVQQLHLRYALAAEAADGYAEAGFDVILQDIILGPDLAWVVERLLTRPLHVVVLTPDPGVVEARDRERQRSGKVAYRPGDQGIVALDAALRAETPHLGLWLDTSELTVEESVNTILEQLETEALVSP
jgi:predicted kinase